jgi:ubiquinone/menaquinone biosynthesis C-methylase UbiE
MNRKIRWNRKSVAENYDFGRPLDEQVILKLFYKLQESTAFSDNSAFLDAGCGTGRITVPLAKHFPNFHFIGVDISEEMLTILKDNLKSQSINNYTVVRGDLLRLDFNNDSFHIVLISSVLHSIEDWKKAIDEIIRVTKPDGYLLLISEQSNLYDLGLGRMKSGNKNVFERFWGKYIEYRIKNELDNPETSQVGIKWRLSYPEVIKYLKDKKHIGEVKRISVDWEKEFKVNDLMRIVKGRSWSSMFTVDHEKYQTLINDLNHWLKESNISLQTPCSSTNILRCEIVRLVK